MAVLSSTEPDCTVEGCPLRSGYQAAIFQPDATTAQAFLQGVKDLEVGELNNDPVQQVKYFIIACTFTDSPRCPHEKATFHDTSPYDSVPEAVTGASAPASMENPIDPLNK